MFRLLNRRTNAINDAINIASRTVFKGTPNRSRQRGLAVAALLVPFTANQTYENSHADGDRKRKQWAMFSFMERRRSAALPSLAVSLPKLAD